MSISPFSFREFGSAEGEFIASLGEPKAFLPQGRKKEAAAPPPPPPPVYSESDLKTADRDGYQRGYLDGIEEGKRMTQSQQADIDAKLAQTVEQFVGHLPHLFTTYREMLRLAGQQVPELASAIAKKVAGAALEEKAYSVIEEIAVRCLESMHHEPKLTIIVHESMAASLEQKINSLSPAQRGEGEITVQPDAHILPANSRIEWKNGQLVRDTEGMWTQVDAVIASMVSSNQRDADGLTDALQELSNQALINNSNSAKGE